VKNVLESFPNTLAPDYIPKALARLLPDPHSLTSKAQIDAWHIEADKLELRIRDNPLICFEPNEGGQREFMTCDDPEIEGRYFFAGNKTGKTCASLICLIEHAVGRALWGLPQRSHLRWRVPVRGAIFCEDFDTHRQDVLPRFFTWCPRSELAETPLINGSTGNPAEIRFKNGSIIYLRTYEQGYAKAEGKDYDIVLCNEPPQRDVYMAIWRGFTATHGIMWIAATLLSQVWLYDEDSNPAIKIFDSSMYDNPWLSDSARRNYEAMMDESERQVRILGRPRNLSGMVYPDFTDKLPYVIPETLDLETGALLPPWNVEKDRPWPIIMAVDPHERKGIYAEWAYVTPLNEILWFDWKIVREHSLTEIFNKLSEIERSHHHPCCLVVMDPNRGRAIQIDGRSWEGEFMEHDYPVQLGIDDMNFGHSQMREYLFGMRPRMRWTQRCLGDGGPIWQMLRYIWQDRKLGSYKEHDVMEKVADVNKDFPDCHRYVACARLEHRSLLDENSGILTLNGRESKHNPYAGERGNPFLHRKIDAAPKPTNRWGPEALRNSLRRSSS
jgi:hypothetical protein